MNALTIIGWIIALLPTIFQYALLIALIYSLWKVVGWIIDRIKIKRNNTTTF